jgi:hypothetical protein
VIDDAIKEFMNANPNEGIRINLFNSKEELVLDRTAKPEELITYQSDVSKSTLLQPFQMANSDSACRSLTRYTASMMSSRSKSSSSSPMNTTNVSPSIHLTRCPVDSEDPAKKEIKKSDSFQKRREEIEKSAATVGQFMPLQRRTSKIEKIIDDIIGYQNFEREREAAYKDNLEALNSSFFRLSLIQILVVLGSAAFSVVSLRKFFVKKHIF